MAIEMSVFFNHPSDPIDLAPLFRDVQSSKRRLALVAAWLTDTELVSAFTKSAAVGKVVVLNKADAERGSRKAVKEISEYMEKRWLLELEKARILSKRIEQLLDEADAFLYLSTTDDLDGYASLWVQAKNIACSELNIDKDIYEDGVSRVSVIGGDDWKSGVMHHKFIVSDDIVWFGSFNFTFNARNNYETLARVVDKHTADAFWEEAKRMALDESFWLGEYSGGGGTIFRCDLCEKVFSTKKERNYNENLGASFCISCSKIIRDRENREHEH